MTEKHYFLYILNKILPEIEEGKLRIQGYAGITDSSTTDNGKPPDTVLGTIIFIKGCTGRENIVLSDGHTIEVKSVNNTRKIFEDLEISPPECKEVNTFVHSQDPAVLFHPEKKTLYCLFDLEELILRLSRLEDETGLRDRHGRFLSIYHINKSRWEIPIVDVIGKAIRDAFGFSAIKRKYGVIMTHDVDRVAVEPTLFIKNIIEKKKVERFALTDEKDYLFQNLMALTDIDLKYAVKSTWFLLSGNYSLKRYGNRYSTNSSKVKKLIAAIAHNCQSVGLHTSFYGAFDFQQTLKEKRLLEETSEQPIYFNRNHYLRFDIRKSIAIYENCGFKADASMGYSDANGFRAGLCQPFHPWNYESGRISKILEIPLLYMDSVKSDDLAESWNDLSRVLFWIKETKSCGSILFHPCSLANNRENQEFYANAIRECQRLDIPFISIDDILDRESGEVNREN